MYQKAFCSLSLLFASLPIAFAQDVVINGDVTPSPADSPQWIIPGDLMVGNTGDGSVTIGGNGTVTSARTLIGESVGSSGTVSISGGSLTSSGGVIVGNNGGYGELTLSGSGAVVTHGFFIGASGTAMGLVPVYGGTGVVRMSGGSLTVNDTTNGEGQTMIGGIMVGVSGYYINYPDVLSPVPVAGTGTFEISGGEVSAGAMYVAFSNPAGATGTVKVSGGTVTLGELRLGFDSTDPFNATLEISGSASVTSNVTTIYKGATSIVKMSGGSWDTTGGVMTSEGTLELSGGALSSGTVVMAGQAKVSGGTWNISGDFYDGGDLEISGTGAVSSKNGYVGFTSGSDTRVTVSGGSWTVSEDLHIGPSGNGTLEVSGSGVVSVQNGITLGYTANFDDYEVDATGAILLSGGTLNTAKVEKGGNSGTITFNGGVLKALRDEANFISGFASGDVTIQSGGAILDTNAHNVLVSASLSGTGALTKRGSGILALGGSNSYSGGTIIESGTLQLGNANALGAADGSLSLNGGVLDLNGQTIAVGLLSGSAGTAIRSSVSGSAGLTVNQNGDSTYAGNIENGASVVHLIKSGTGTLTLSGSNSYSGGTTVTAGILAVRSNHSTTFGTLGSGTTTVQGGALFAQNGGTLSFLDSADAGTGTFVVNSGAAPAAAGGLIRFGDTSSAGSGTFTNNGALLAGASFAATRFEGNSSAESAKLIANGGSNGGLGGVISFVDDSTGGTSQVELYGNGGLAISLHNPGSVSIGSLAGDGKVVLGSNNLAVGGNNLNTTFSGLIEGNGGSLTKEGTGTLTLSGSNGYSGSTMVTAGILAVKNNQSTTFGTLGSGTTTVQGGALLAENGGTLSFLDSADAGTGTFVINSGAAPAAAGGLIRFGDTSSAGSGTFTNNGALLAGASFAATRFEGNSSAGSAKLIADGGSNGGLGGVISFVDESTGGTSQVELYGNGGLAISLHNPGSVAIGSLAGDGKVVLGSNNLAVGGNNLSTTFSGAIEGTDGSLTKEGTGTLNLSGLNTYNGRTMVSAGTLLLNGTLSASEVTVQNGGTLGGSGFATNVVLENGGVLAPGNSIGTLSLNTLTWNGGGELVFELGMSTSDLLNLDGELSKGNAGAFNFTFENSGWQVGQTYTLIAFSSTNFNLEDFGFTNGGGFDGYFELMDDSLNFTLNAIPEPSTWGLMIAGLLLPTMAARRKVRRGFGRHDCEPRL